MGERSDEAALRAEAHRILSRPAPSGPGALRRWLLPPLLSPAWLATRALLAPLALLALHLAGARESVALLSGNVPDSYFAAAAGLAYAGAWFSTVAGTPVMLGAAVIDAGLLRVLAPRYVAPSASSSAIR